MKIEIWNGREIRFVEKEAGDWWAVAKDVAEALQYKDAINAIKQHCPRVAKHHLGVATGTKQDGTPAMQEIEMNIIPESDIYRLIFRSNLPEAEEFQDWVCDMLKKLREKSKLEGYQVFRMMDTEFQKDAMRRLKDGMFDPAPKNYIKANTIANKATSTIHGYPKMLKKEDMTPEMLSTRQVVLAETVTLMTANDSFNLGLSVSKTVYDKYKDERKRLQ